LSLGFLIFGTDDDNHVLIFEFGLVDFICARPGAINWAYINSRF
jgi:hypothetical protein